MSDPQFEFVAPDQLVPNPWNPNVQAEKVYTREIRSIQQHGFIDPITVRRLPTGELQIVDGEHRWKAACALGLKQVPITNLGDLPDSDAKRLTILLNELRGEPEVDKLAALLSDLASSTSVADLAQELPITEADMSALISSFDWELPPATLSDSTGADDAPPAAPAPTRGIGELRKFRVGGVAGEISKELCNQFVVEYKKAAREVGSSDPEQALRALLDKLPKE